MKTVRLRSGANAYVSSARPDYPYGGPDRNRLLIDHGTARALIRFPLEAGSTLPPGATVVAARLGIAQVGDWPTLAGRTLTSTFLGRGWVQARVTWNSQPDTTGTGVTVSKDSSSDMDYWVFPVTDDVTAVFGGDANHGWQISTSDTTARRIRGFDADVAKPYLEIDYTLVPDAPTGQHPNGGATGVSAPTLTWSAARDATAYQVQVDPAGNGTAPAYDSGTVVSTAARHKLAGTSFTPLTAGASTQWRVRVQNDMGWSDWSPWATFPYTPKLTVVITNPPTTSTDDTPPTTWTVTGGTETAWQVITTGPAGHVFDDSKRAAGSDLAYSPTNPVKQDGVAYTTEVRVWDDVDRDPTPGDPVYANDTVTWVFDYDPTPAPVDTLTASQASVAAPWVTLSFTRSQAPDAWRIIRDGEHIATVDGTDLLPNGTTYTWVDWTAVPARAHTYRVAPKVNGKIASGGPTVSYTPTVMGVWLGDPDSGAQLCLLEQSVDLTYGEQSDTFTPVGGSSVVRMVTGSRGLEGTIAGTVVVTDQTDPRSIPDQFADAVTLKQTGRLTPVRLVAGALNIPVILGGFTLPVPSAAWLSVAEKFDVSASVWQDGELPYDTDI